MGIKELDNQKINKPNLSIEKLSDEILANYLDEESKWIDEVFAEKWPRVFSWFAQRVNKRIRAGKTPNFFTRLAIFIMARFSGLTIHRNQHLKVFDGKGFSGKPKTVVDRATVTIKRHGKEVAKRDFKLSIY